MRKATIWCVILCILFQIAVVYAEDHDLPTNFVSDEKVTMVKTDFEDYRGYYTGQRQISPPYWNGWGTNGSRFYADVLDKAHGKSFCMETSGLYQTPYTSITDAVIFDYAGDFVFEIEFYSDANAAVRTIMLRGNNNYYNIARWKADGSFLLDYQGGYEVIAHPEIGVWHKYIIIYNSEKDSCNVYLDNKKVCENIKINSQMKDGVKGVRIKQEGIDKGKCKAYYDNLALYSGNKVQDFSDIAPMKTLKNMLDTEVFAQEIKDALVLKIDSRYAYSDGVRVPIYEGEDNQKVRLIDGTTYVPVRFVVEHLGAEARYNAADGTVGIGKTKSYPGRFDDDDKKVYNVYSTTSDIEDLKMYIFDDRAYVPLRSLAEKFGKEVTYLEKDKLIFIADTQRDIDTTTTKYRDLVSRLTYKYSEPTAQEIKSKFVSNTHPRIMVNAEQFEYLKANKDTDELLNTIYTKVKVMADGCLDDSYPEYNPAKNNAESCLGIIRTAQSNIMMCAAMYRLTEDEKYKERVYSEAKNLCEWIDWNYVHFLDTAEAATAVAVAYDWLYYDWTDEERELLANGIKKHALDEAIKSFNGSGWSDWIRLNNNWSFVCNGGISMAAMALFDLYPDTCAQIISNNFKSLAYALPYLAPEGAWEEGTSYWQYLMRFYVPMLASLNYTFNTEFGYMDMVEGASETAYFTPYMTGPAGEFNYHDGSGGFSDTAFHFWLAKRLNDKELGGYRMNNILQIAMPSAYDLIWYNADYCNIEANMPLDRLYTENVTTATFRSSWSDRGALFAGMHGGANNVNHGHLDIGQFVIDARGESFFCDLGADNYNIVDDNGQSYLGSVNFYRRRAEGHNTIVVNPPGKKVDTFWYDQKKEATGIVTDFVSKPRGGYIKLDMSQSSDDIETATRGLMMADGRNNVILQDEVVLKRSSDFWWFAHTKADITISEDGRSALAVRNGKYMNITIQSDDDSLKFGVMDAVPLEGSPNPPSQNKNLDVKKLYIHKENAKSFNAAVVFTPLSFKDEPVQLPEYKALADWEIADGEIDRTFSVEITDVKVNGKSVEDFYSLQKIYNVNIDAVNAGVPEVSAEYAGDATLEIYQAKDIKECAILALTDNKSGKTVYYSIGFSMIGREGLPDGLSEYEISGVEASEEPQSENPKEATIDGNIETRWSAEGKQSITYDLGTVQNIAAISTAWHNSNIRMSYFIVEVSEDGESWNTIFSGNTISEYSGYNTMFIDDVKARYVRIIGLGNSVNNWNSLLEVKIFGDK